VTECVELAGGGNDHVFHAAAQPGTQRRDRRREQIDAHDFSRGWRCHDYNRRQRPAGEMLFGERTGDWVVFLGDD
jgi:hypothetical protein